MENEQIEVIIIEIVELEEHAKHHHDKPAPHAKHYAFRVDKERIVVDTPTISGKDILAKVGKKPEGFKLYQHRRGHQPILIAPDHIVNLREPGVERFTTMPKDTTEGLGGLCTRQDFRLPEADESYMTGLELTWEALFDGAVRWLIIHDWKVPAGYTRAQVTLAILIPNNYSDSPLDMVYFKEPLARTDGRPIGALASQVIAGVPWQRWSRHRTAANPWCIGIDDIASHLAMVDEWLNREFAKAA